MAFYSYLCTDFLEPVQHKLMNSTKVELSLLFETSWEVCNKVGGIYTVLSTKAKNLQTLYKDKIIFIGPDVWSEQSPCPVFTESKTILKKWRENVILPDGVSVRVGRWNVPGRPIAVLVKFDGMYAVKNEFYGMMWNQFGVDSLHAYGDYDEACAFSHAAAIVIESIVNFTGLRDSANVVAHFDEWTTGMGLLYLKSRMPRIATVFTTHATSIGRSICGNGKDLYRYFKGYNGDQMARELNMEAKHSLEKAAAHNADCFTTVSDITADECEQLLEIGPHVVTPNGFEENFVPEPSKYVRRKAAARKKLLSVASALSGKAYDDSAFIVITAGRCEYRNKGLDVFIDSINRLKNESLSRPVLAFVMVPAWVKEFRADLREKIAEKGSAELPEKHLTHWLNNMESDSVLAHIRRSDFDSQSVNADVIYVPCYLNGDDGIFNKSYYDLLVGADATVFPSYYEPWGYTPLESIAFGVPTVTTSLSGFGRWILPNFANDIFETGVKVVHRDDTNYHQVCEDIADTLKQLDESSKKQSLAASMAAQKTAREATWNYFIKYYINAFSTALENASKRQ